MHHPSIIHHLAATLHTLGMRLTDRATDWIDPHRHRLVAHGADRGSVTIEQVIWAVAVIAIVGIVVAAVKAYVTTQAAKLR